MSNSKYQVIREGEDRMDSLIKKARILKSNGNISASSSSKRNGRNDSSMLLSSASRNKRNKSSVTINENENYNNDNLRNSITALDPSSFQSATMKKMLGIVEDKKHIMSLDFKGKSDLIYLLGESYNNISRFNYKFFPPV